MAGILIIGAGGVSGVAVHKCAQAADVFTDICRLCTFVYRHSADAAGADDQNSCHFYFS